MSVIYQKLNIQDIILDFENPRIAKFVEMYGKDNLTGEAIALALGSGSSYDGNTSYNTLKESIKSSGGIIHPIIVNKRKDNKYLVVEGNTRVQIYKDFIEQNVEGKWNDIIAIVYDNLTDDEIHSIRLQSHLVGPRDWDPYSKAKYLNYLSNEKKMPMNQLISFCGGKQSEICKLINAYNDMEKYYRKNLTDDSEFDQRDFSKFVELQNTNVKETIVGNGFSIDDFAKWVINGNIDSAINIRKIPLIFKVEEAKRIFLKSNITDAYKKVVIEDSGARDLDNIPYELLANELANRLDKIEYKEVQFLKNDLSYAEKKNSLYDVFENLKYILDTIKEEE